MPRSGAPRATRTGVNQSAILLLEDLTEPGHDGSDDFVDLLLRDPEHVCDPPDRRSLKEERENDLLPLVEGRGRNQRCFKLLRAGDLLAPARRVAEEEQDHRLADTVEVGAERLQHLRGDALALADQPEQDVLGADEVVSQAERLAERELEDLLGTGRKRM